MTKQQSDHPKNPIEAITRLLWRNYIGRLVFLLIIPFILATSLWNSIPENKKSDAIDYLTDKIKHQLDRDKDFDKIVVKSYKYSPEKTESLCHFLREKGYKVDKIMLSPPRPNWLAYKSSVLYYKPEMKHKAKQIATILNNYTELRFTSSVGAGKTILTESPDNLIIIHVIGN